MQSWSSHNEIKMELYATFEKNIIFKNQNKQCMKQNLKKITLLFITAMLLGSCEKDESNTQKNETNKITRKKISLAELKNHEKIFSKFEEVSKKTNTDINNRLVIDTLYNFIIDTENMILNQYENYTSITAPIFRINNNKEVVENLFIHKTNSGSYKAFIVKYSLSDSDLVNYSNNIPISNLASKTSFIVLDNFNLNNINNRDNSLENTTYSGGYSGIVYNIDGQCYRIHEVFQDGTFSLIHCPGCSCSSNNNSVPNVFENDGSGGTSNVLIFTWPTSGGEDYDPFSGIGGSGGNYSGGNTLITEPVVVQNKTEQKLLQSFTTLEQSNWWLFVASDETKDDIINYLNQNTINNVFDPQAEQFVLELIDYCIENNNYQINSFVDWSLNYIINNPYVSIEQFKNWFMTSREGKDPLDYDSNFWENPNLSFPQQDLPSWNDFDLTYPRVEGEALVQTVGGAVQAAYNQYPSLSRGYCALKVSRALNYSGINIPQITTTSGNPGTLQGGDGKYYFLNAKALNKWMRETFGTNPLTNSTPYNNSHHHFSANDGGVNGENFPNLVNGLKGIFSMVSTNPNWASGHADLIEDGICVFGCHFQDVPPAPIDYIDIWILE
jgi:hypothetical protein